MIAGGATNPEGVRQAIKGHDAVVCVPRLVFLSNFGVLHEAAPDLRWAVMMPFARFKIRNLREHPSCADFSSHQTWRSHAMLPASSAFAERSPAGRCVCTLSKP